MSNPNPDLTKLAELCPEMVATITQGEEKTLCLRVVSYELEDIEAIAARILKLGAGMNEAYRALYGTENGNRAFDEFIEKERG